VLRSDSDLTQFPTPIAEFSEGVRPLTGDGSQFDAPLDHTDPSPIAEFALAPVEAGSRTPGLLVALVVGLAAGFAGGFFIGQQRASIPSPRVAAEVAPAASASAPSGSAGSAPVQASPTTQERTYTEAAVAEVAESKPPVDAPPAPAAAPVEPPPLRAATPAIAPVRSQPGSLVIASRPDGAQVFVDGRRAGVTPMSTNVPPGSHRIRIELGGHRPWETAVDVGSDTNVRVGASLTENPKP